jgi:ubiquinone/menaquinone biosynthesis C-methylase UbiE
MKQKQKLIIIFLNFKIEKMNGNFSKIAWIYDFIKKIIFLNSLDRATNYYFKEIPLNAQILICGGGTGQLLGDLVKINNRVKIDYVELSEKMIQKASKRNTLKLEINYLQSDIFSTPLQKGV